eukprot:scaffold103331_cov27-Tisochrysis_lutea.AAC.1
MRDIFDCTWHSYALHADQMKHRAYPPPRPSHKRLRAPWAWAYDAYLGAFVELFAQWQPAALDSLEALHRLTPRERRALEAEARRVNSQNIHALLRALNTNDTNSFASDEPGSNGDEDGAHDATHRDPEMDSHANCTMWAQGGECERNPAFMLETCAAACVWLNERGASSLKQRGRLKAEEDGHDHGPDSKDEL